MIVSNHVGVSSELILSNSAWKLPLNIEVWTKLIKSFLENPQLLNRPKNEARNWVKKNMDINITTKLMYQFYENVISLNTL